MKFFKLLLVIAFSCTSLALAETTSAATEPLDLSGTWKVVLENSYTRKQITFRIEQKDGRMRGKMASKEIGSQDLDGRQAENGEILFWSTFRSREGISTETSFKGRMEGEAIVGKARFFEKPYNFRAERSE